MEGIKAPLTPTNIAVDGEDATSPSVPPLTEEEILRMEFYKTYDVMTGVRIAATLGGELAPTIS